MSIRVALYVVALLHCATTMCAAQNQGGAYYTPTYTYNNYQASGFGGRKPSQPQYRPPQQQQYRPPQQTGGSTMAGLEQVLNQVDNSNWNNVPVSGRQQQQAPRQVASMTGQMPMPMSGFPAGSANGMHGMFPKMSRQEMTRIFFEGGSPMGMGMGMGGGGGAAPPQNNSAATSTAYSNYQTACNEESKSRNYANTARYDESKWNRKNAAEQAEYAANNANYAAQRAESAAYNGNSEAQGYANLARQAANRARENANQARYNADTMP